MVKPTRDIGASVRARLLTLARERGEVFDLLLTRYALERLLYRLSTSPHRDRFILKGAMLVTTWFAEPHRPTRDLDLLGYGDSSPAVVLEIFKEICDMQLEDGIQLDSQSLRVDLIREELAYGGLRIRTTATMASARIPVIVDIGFGDAVEPGVEDIDLPVLLDLPAPRLRAYARETVIAEKFQAMVALGRVNSRMKDFYDVWVLSKTFDFGNERLAQAIAATFARRDTTVPESLPDALTPEFARDPAKQQQWSVFVRNLSGDAPSLEIVIADLASFLSPSMTHARARNLKSNAGS